MDIFEKCFLWDEAKVARAAGYYPYFQPIEENEGSEAVIYGKRVIMIGANNYLGLATDPRVKEAAAAAARTYGSSCCGSRFLNGTLTLHVELEDRLARFLRRDRAIVFSTGFQTNLGTLSPLLTRHDVAVLDKTVHASLVDGVRLGMGEVRRFRHNDAGELDRELTKAGETVGKLVIVDGLFSMEGDLADLHALLPVVKKHSARILVDDAHGLGVLGEHGRGTCEHLGVENQVDLITGTFSKAFGSLGGVLAGPADVIDYIQHKSRALIFSASMTPASVGACLKSLEIIEAEPERRARLRQISRRMREGFRSMGFDVGLNDTPVIPLVVGDDQVAFRFWKELLEAGVYTNPVISPAVPPGRQLLRTSYMATHTDDQLSRVLETVEKVGKRLGILGAEHPTAQVAVA